MNTSTVLRLPPRLGWSLRNICVTNDHGYVPFVVNTPWSFPRSRLFTEETQLVPLVEQELLILPKHLSWPPTFSGVRVSRALIYMSDTASATRGGGIAYTSGAHHKYFMHIQVQQYIKQMHRNKGGATTFDCYWKSSLKSWVRTKLLATNMHLLYVVMCKNDVQRVRNDASFEYDTSPWYFVLLPEIPYRNRYPVQAVWFYCSENCLGFQSFNFEHTWWRLIRKSVVRRKFYIYGFSSSLLSNT